MSTHFFLCKDFLLYIVGWPQNLEDFVLRQNRPSKILEPVQDKISVAEVINYYFMLLAPHAFTTDC